MESMDTRESNSLDPDIVGKRYTGYKLCSESCKIHQFVVIKNGSLDVKIKHINENICLITWLEPIND